MKQYFLILILVCAGLYSPAQTNFVKNPGFEKYSICPERTGQIFFALPWRNTLDSLMFAGSDYHNVCANLSSYPDAKVPENPAFYQFPHSGNGMVGSGMYFDKLKPLPPPYTGVDIREYSQGYLHENLIAGKNYCVSFWINLTEGSGYAHNKIGAYLDDGGINSLPLPVGSEITSVLPQVYTDSIIKDTANWIKIEGSFIASGDENHITIGNFFSNSTLSTIVTDYYHVYTTQSYYLIDDVSVIESDLPAKAGPDNWVEETKVIQIGRVGDTTAEGLDCKWYHRGNLIDSGAIITVQAGHKGDIDTYAVVQTICGNIKTDTVLIHTVGVGMQELITNNAFSVYPNPSDGILFIAAPDKQAITATISDLSGRVLFKINTFLVNGLASLRTELPSGTYMLKLDDQSSILQYERITMLD